MTRKLAFLRPAIVLLCVVATFGRPAAAAGLRKATVLIIRHAEKPDDGDGLSPAGEARANRYIAYFQNFAFQDKPVKLDAVFAAADSKSSRRPRLTVEPLAAALGLAVNASYKDKDYLSLVDELRAHREGKNILICWHHGEMPELLKALGADPNTLLPDGHWPGDTYNWVVILRYDADGHVKEAQRIGEGF